MVGSVSTVDAPWVPWQKDARVVGYVGLAHLTSHFFQLIIAPLFPWLRVEFGYSFAALGFVMSVLFIVSGVSQALAGFVVDRFGPGVTLIGGLCCLAFGALGFALSHDYVSLLLSAGTVGLGNGVFHPVDYSLLNQRVSVARIGPAYSVHGVTGSLGWALAPVFLVSITASFGWRASVLAAAGLPLLVAALLMGNRDLIRRTPSETAATTPTAANTQFGFLRLTAIWWCFAFFCIVAAAASGVQNFAPTIFTALYGLTVANAALCVTLYMLASATGMLAGGWLLLRGRAVERNITLAFALSITAAILIGVGVLPATLALVCIVVMGFGSGLAGPSRDMLIRSVTPRGASGRVYGVVYSGLDLGIAVGPVVFGKMLDHGHYAAVFYAIAGCFFVAMLTAWRVAAKRSI